MLRDFAERGTLEKCYSPFSSINLEPIQTVTNSLAELFGISLPEHTQTRLYSPRLVQPI